jgi:BirA family transcriptional regulator, biotin operon repressor / biotin---[acetyl-CoA-carboxylase] ligase
MAKCTALILNSKKDGLFDAINPGMIAEHSALWKQDIGKFGPWRKTDRHRLTDDNGGYVWQAETCTEGQTVVICGKCTSSMDVAWHFIARNCLQEWDSILAVEQSAGRGQHQRTWISPSGNIYAAWRWPHPGSSLELGSQWQGFVSLIAGYLMARIIKEEYGLPVEIKWPNDLLLNSRKFGGILTEVRSGQLVVGIGINITFSPEAVLLRDDFAVPATNLSDEGADTAPLSLWMKIVEKGRCYLNQLTTSVTPAEFIKALTPYLALVGQKVLVKTIQQKPLAAVIAGISDQGGLILRIADKDMVIYTGSIIPI